MSSDSRNATGRPEILDRANPLDSEDLLCGILQASLSALMVFQSVRDAVGTIVDFRCRLVNPAALRFSGRPASDYVGSCLSEIHPRSWQLGLFDRYVQLLETGEPQVFELCDEGDGKPRWLRVSLVKIGDGFALCYDDITANRLADEALRHSEEFANAVFEGSPAGKQIFGTDGTLLRTNEAFRRFMRLPSRDHGVGTWNILNDPTAESFGFAGAFRLALRGETVDLPNQSVDLGRAQDRSLAERQEIDYDAAFFPINDESGAVRAVVLTVWDTTDRRRAEEALHLSERFAKAIFDHAPVAIQIYDPDGTSRRLNEAQRRLLGLPSLDYGVGVYNALTDELTQQYGISDQFRRALGGEVVEQADQVVDLGHPANPWRTDRRRIVFNQVLFPIHGKKGEVEAVVAMAWDNTTREEAEKALLRLTQAQNDFISTVSHELRTPLTSIRGSLALLAADIPGTVPEPLRPLIGIALRNTERLLTLINDLLDIQRIESASLDLELEAVDLSLLVQEALEDHHSFGSQLGVSFWLVHTDPGLLVRADPHRLMQLMANLLSNAAKFSPPDGIVEISVERKDTQVRVSVRDHGPGIAEDFRPRLFTRFAQADSSTTRQKGGTGLGLSICKALIETMGGTIGFDTTTEPSPGHGTTLHFELPLLEEALG
jgi:signal transduction histidine kinase